MMGMSVIRKTGSHYKLLQYIDFLGWSFGFGLVRSNLEDNA